jgi:hypothetical protein
MGLITVLQFGHSQKNWHESVGISSFDWCLHSGQVNVDSVSMVVLIILNPPL